MWLAILWTSILAATIVGAALLGRAFGIRTQPRRDRTQATKARTTPWLFVVSVMFVVTVSAGWIGVTGHATLATGVLVASYLVLAFVVLLIARKRPRR